MAEQTPMMRQYQEIRAQYPGKILFFRLGDFYEMFDADAQEVSQLLGLTLTHRQGVPMCGIPHHSSQSYLRKLLDSGRSVAVCEQVSVPGADKGIVRRQVVEVLTPGTLVEDGYLSSAQSNVTLCISLDSDLCGLAAADLSTGLLRATHFRLLGQPDSLERELSRFQPREVLVAEEAREAYPFLNSLLQGLSSTTVTAIPRWRFDQKGSERRLKEHFGTASLQAFGLVDKSPETLALGVLLEYWQLNSPGRSLSHIQDIHLYSATDFLQIDPQSSRSLELVQNTRDGSSEFTVFSVLDQTLTASGSRTLKSHLIFPLMEADPINQRLDAVEALVNDAELLKSVRAKLAGQMDVERLSARLALDKASPRDLLALETSVHQATALANLLEGFPAVLSPDPSWPRPLRDELLEWADLCQKTLVREPNGTITEGGLIEAGVDSALDDLRALRDHSQEILDAYLLEEQGNAKLPQLRIKYNRILGYYFEVTKSRLDQLPGHFRRKQSLVGSERFTTPRLAEIEESLLHAQDRIYDLEKALFLALRERAKLRIAGFLSLAKWVSTVDVCASLAKIAVLHRYTRPRFTGSGELSIVDGRHPVVEVALADRPFVPNSVTFSQTDSLFLITGPNMAGKSTYLRQTALIVLLGQIGSFVPAAAASWDPVDRIFCRVGASDHLARGESTFLVEMNETAHILRNATSASLVIMDEVGRGTSTRDGFSLAWAICEHLLEVVAAKTLFATHFHELTALKHPALKNYSMAVLEEGEEVVFLKKVVEGPADHSYGLHVARLAGVPSPVVARAQQILENLPSEESTAVPKRMQKAETQPQLDLFSAPDSLREELQSLDLERMTPLDALNLLASWKQRR